eukprot:maker-scaffold_14-snap-gene-4.52-mRNA-1 protein AED:0.01 eAED:0.01 QI:160/1/1/1/0.66/0.5/4/258/478
MSNPLGKKRSIAAAWNLLINSEEDSKTDLNKDKVPESIQAEEMLYMNDGTKLIILLVGKAARGKSNISGKIKRYLSWLGNKTMHFEVSKYRKKLFGSSRMMNKEQRKKAQAAAISDLMKWLKSGGQVAIYDTKNNTRQERTECEEEIEEQFSKVHVETDDTYRTLWIESYCEDMEKVEENFLRGNRKKYSNKTGEEAALKDFRSFLSSTDLEYESLDPQESKDLSFIKLIDFGATMVTHKVKGYIESKIASFCVNLHTEERRIFLVRHGESQYNIEDRLGGDSGITQLGDKFAQALGGYMGRIYVPAKEGINGERPGKKSKHDFTSNDLVVYTSNLKRTIQTGRYITCNKRVSWFCLSEIDAGVCEGMSYTEFKVNMFAEYSARQRDKLNWRYPQGESYVDVKKRLEPVIFEIERMRQDLIIIAHRAVLRCLYSYFADIEDIEVPFLPIPLHTLIILKSDMQGWKEERVALDPTPKAP